MKNTRLSILFVLFLLCLATGMIFAQDATQEVTPDATAETTLPSPMETELIPCGEGVTGPCDLIATSPEDIVGVWKQYLLGAPWSISGGIAYIQYFADGTYFIADTIEHSAEQFENFPSGTYQFDGDQFIIDPIPGSPAPCDGAGIFQLRVLKYGDQPVALRYVTINDSCNFRQQDLSQALVWAAPNS